ncbi:MAG TPA: enoyl-CoA hydratase/isomerase family protein [Syntrophales bacterium]|nr:enoyl-CoA hydratase/isomerase family protein [Syntrophales bacterium]HPC01365.1 enoyl-CoA hydratase/isomerase family protein [Syntrophales bacterium]HPQ06745.1 enoyl-CoA hydratase/isomerase family protein [Syntrophales bacterium]
MSGETILTEVRDGLAVLTLNRPERHNAISIKMRQEIISTLVAWREDPAVGMVIITGAGPSFTAGFDLGEFKVPELLPEIFRTSSLYHRELWRFPKPTLAAVNGPALAGGFDLAKLCDMRICSEKAAFGHPEIRFTPTLYTPLKWIVGTGPARDLCLTGRTIDAQEAFRIGLVSEVTKPEVLLERASEIGRGILKAPAHVLATVKRFFVENDAWGFEESFCREHDAAFQEFIMNALAGSFKKA